MLLGLQPGQIPSHLYAPMRRLSDELEAKGYHIRINAGQRSPDYVWAMFGGVRKEDRLIFSVYWNQSIWEAEDLDDDWKEFICSGLVPTTAVDYINPKGRKFTVFLVNTKKQKSDGTTDLSVEG